MKTLDTKGDDYLSANDSKLWALTYHCLIRFGCPVIFKHWPNNVANKSDGLLQFFVPSQHDLSLIVVEFLTKELQSFSFTDEPGYGTKVEVLLFSGVKPYLESNEVEQMAQQAMNKFYKILRNRIN